MNLDRLAKLLLLQTGCGNGLASVSGSVTLDGEKMLGGPELRVTVLMSPKGGGPSAAALVDSNGNFLMSTGSKSGIAPGKYLVAVSGTQIIPPKDPKDTPGGRPVTPRQYANPKLSGLQVEVEPGSNQFDLELKSEPASRS